MKQFATVVFALFALALAAIPAHAQGGDSAALVNSYYQQYLGRNADPGGMATWLAQLQAAGPVAVQAGILGSDEFYQKWGSTPQGFVAGLYSAVLSRSASPAEIQSWLNVLAQDGGSRQDLAAQFLNAAQTELSQRQVPNPPVYTPPARRFWDGDRNRYWKHLHSRPWEGRYPR